MTDSIFDDRQGMRQDRFDDGQYETRQAAMNTGSYEDRQPNRRFDEYRRFGQQRDLTVRHDDDDNDDDEQLEFIDY